MHLGQAVRTPESVESRRSALATGPDAIWGWVIWVLKNDWFLERYLGYLGFLEVLFFVFTLEIKLESFFWGSKSFMAL